MIVRKILFIETKWKAHFWKMVADEIRTLDPAIEIHWLVSNPLYLHGLDELRQHQVYLQEGRAANRPELSAEDMTMIAASDRMTHFYGADDRDYSALADKVWQVIDDVRPDLVVGEAVLPVELLAACMARHAGMLFLSPLTTRYPSGRFYLYEYESYVPYIGEYDSVPTAQGESVVNAIREGRVVPDYMRDVFTKLPRNRLARLATYVRSQYLNVLSLLRRDPETPSFRYRFLRILEIHLSMALWQLLVWHRRRICRKGGPLMLYPLQVQPEANLDVVGWKFRKQEKLITEIVANMPGSAVLVVKSNPKPKCEMNLRLIRQLWREPRCLPLPLRSSMREQLPQMELVITVTGTVALECIAHGVPVVSLSATPKNIFHPLHVDDPWNVIADPGCWQNQLVSKEDAAKYFSWVISRSWPGEISDPLNHPRVAASENRKAVAKAIYSALQRHVGECTASGGGLQS